MMISCLVVGFLLLMVPVVVLVASPGFGFCASALNAACICRTPTGEGGGSKAQGGGVSPWNRDVSASEHSIRAKAQTQIQLCRYDPPTHGVKVKKCSTIV
jgi:hypothetical protein